MAGISKANNGIWVIILAAGESKRMQTPKLILPFGKLTIIETVVENAMNSIADHIMVVLGAYREEIEKILEGRAVQQCINENYREGMLTSVRTGFRSIPGNFKAAIVIPGDQPLIPPEAINMVIEAWEKSGNGIVIPAYQGKRGHPILIASQYKAEIEKLNPEVGLNALSIRFSSDVCETEVDIPDILTDIDTKEDYLKIIKQNL
jgi:molybdenum cofactor cytidylyltransferase